MNLYLLIRRSEGYYYHQKIDLKHVVKDAVTVGEVIKGWDLSIPYMEFRQRLVAISSLTIKNGQRWSNIIPWSDKHFVSNLPPSSWLVPLDEDDWLHPNFVDIFRNEEIPEDKHVVTWGVVRKEADGTFLKQPNAFVESCGYAVRLPCLWSNISNHMTISLDDTYSIPIDLAVRNETPASIGFMVKGGDPRQALTSPNQTSDVGPLLPWWVEKQLKAYRQLLREAL